MADQVLMPNQTTHGHPRNGFWKNFWCTFFHSSSHSIMMWLVFSFCTGQSLILIHSIFKSSSRIFTTLKLLKLQAHRCRQILLLHNAWLDKSANLYIWGQVLEMLFEALCHFSIFHASKLLNGCVRKVLFKFISSVLP